MPPLGTLNFTTPTIAVVIFTMFGLVAFLIRFTPTRSPTGNANALCLTFINLKASVFWCEFVTANAMNFVSVTSRWTKASHRVFSSGDGFQVNRVHAVAAATEMVDLQDDGNGPHEYLIREAVGAKLRGFIPEHTVAHVHNRANPNPARNAFERNIGIYANLSKEAREKFSVYGKSVRFVLHDLISLKRTDCVWATWEFDSRVALSF